MPHYEIQVLVSDDSTSPMTRIDRCTLTAENLAGAAATYAALFTSNQARSRPAAARIREHRGFGHGLRPGEDHDMNCPSCLRERAEDTLVPYEDSTIYDGGDDEPWDNSASSLLPTGALMNPAHPEGAVYYDEHQVAYIVRQLSPGDPAGTHGPVRVLTSYGRLRGWTLDTEHAIRHDQSGRSLGLWLITGIRNHKTGWQAGEIPDRPLRQWVFK
jgi:hypothetical protein